LQLPPGRYDITAFTEGGADFGRVAAVTLSPGETKEGLRLVAGPPPAGVGFGSIR
jgi:hypothetical protein